MPVNHDYVSGAEFKRWMDEESGFRSRIESRMGDGFVEIKASVARVEQLQREANGRTGKLEQSIAVVQRDIEAVRSSDANINRAIESIQTAGCNQFTTHRATLGVLEGAGYTTDSQGDERHQFRLPHLTPKQKAVAGVGVSALLVPALAELFKLGAELLRYLQGTG